MKKYKNLQLQIEEEYINMLRDQKKIQRKSMSEIVQMLINEKYGLKFRIKNIGE